METFPDSATLHTESGRAVVAHGVDRGAGVDGIRDRAAGPAPRGAQISYAVSPAFGPVPPVAVPDAANVAALLWHAADRLAHRRQITSQTDH
jgi:hypothetical protein